MNTIHRPIMLALAGMLCAAVWAQQGALRAGDKAYDALAYVRAIDNYERAARQGAPDSAFADRLARSYYAVRDLEKARHWFARSAQQPHANAEDLYLYSQTLRAEGRFDEADEWLKKYQAVNEVDSRTYRQSHSANTLKVLLEGTAIGCDIHNLDINSAGADMAATYVNGAVVFASDRKPDVAERLRHAWNGRAFLDLYKAEAMITGDLSHPQLLDGLNTKYHDAAAAFTADGKTVYFTRNNFSKGQKGLNNKGVMDLKIYRCELVNGVWTNETPFAYNSNEYSTGHPALSPDGRTLYFTSDMPGGIGGTDIWKCTWENDAWSKPVNMGSTLNTEGNEMFPFMSASGNLFFASDGQLGLGGLDILSCYVTGKEVGPPKNPGAPINSDHDDFALVLDGTGLHGYFTSNRPGGKGDDDLYSFSLQKQLGPQMYVKGKVRDSRGSPITGATVELKDEQGKMVASVPSESDGSYTFTLDPDVNYHVAAMLAGHRGADTGIGSVPAVDTTLKHNLVLARYVSVTPWVHVVNASTGAAVPDVLVQLTDAGHGNAELINAKTDTTGDVRKPLTDRAIGDTLVFDVLLNKEGYFPKQGRFTAMVNEEGQVAIHQRVDLAMDAMEVGTDIGKVIDLKPIYFDVNSAEIRADAATELDKVVALMNEYPDLRIELGSHTDSRGSAAANKALSAKRAKSSVAYIVDKGIAQDRIKGKGYGESKPLNQCKDRVPCTEEEYQLNRRTEFIITKM